ncbi:MAG: hypothetical protein JXB45_00395 [Candidatus Krumholzibacteriota bacterium]|nr:hypothetical protein [Candidatus Krumholzibacteriota bacterium]
MKKVLLLTAALCLLAGNSIAGPYGYVGVYLDMDRLVCESYATSGVIIVYVFHHGNDLGFQSAEFAMTYPTACYNIGKTPNPDYTLVMDDPTSPTGGAITFLSCDLGWKWSYMIQVLVAAPVPGYIEVVPHPATGLIQQAECTAGFPLYEVIQLNKFGFQQPCWLADDAEDASWGAIKGMYSE